MEQKYFNCPLSELFDAVKFLAGNPPLLILEPWGDKKQRISISDTRELTQAEERQRLKIPDGYTASTTEEVAYLVEVKSNQSAVRFVGRNPAPWLVRFFERIDENGNVLNTQPVTQPVTQADKEKKPPRVPQRDKELSDWMLRWQHIGGRYKAGQFGTLAACKEYLTRYHPGFACEDDVLSDTIRAGMAGLLDFPETS